MTTLTPFLLGLLVTAGLLVPLILRLRAAAAEANERADALTDQFAQLLMSRQDLSSETAQGRIKPGPDALPGLRPDFIAPLIFDQETLGLIVVARPRKTAGDAKAALRLIAQAGAQALHAAASYSRMRTSAEMDGLTQIFNKGHMEQALTDLIYRTACLSYDRRSLGDQEPSAGLAIL